MGEDLSHHNSVNTVSDSIMSDDEHQRMSQKVTNISRISRGYNKRRENGIQCVLPTSNKLKNNGQSPKSAPPKTKKKGYNYFRFEAKSRGSKKLAKLIGK